MVSIGSLSIKMLCSGCRKIKCEVNGKMTFWTEKRETYFVHFCSLKNKDRKQDSIGLFSSCIIDSSCLCVFGHKHKAAVSLYLRVVIYINCVVDSDWKQSCIH